MGTRVVVAVLLAGLAACSTGRADAPPPSRAVAPPPSTTVASVPDPAGDGVLRILFLGNSHTARYDVPGTVAALVRSARPGTRVETVREPHYLHLQERADHRPTLDLIASRPWDAVVLQAENYSLSDPSAYPATGGRSLVRRVRARHAQPVLYAEWARRGIDETQRIVAAYRRVQRTCLPPVPEAFELARTSEPSLELLAADGNHSSAAGAFLASAVLAHGLTGRPLANLPAVPGIPVDRQARLRQVADDAWDGVAPERACKPLR